jgi:hypothetical protein
METDALTPMTELEAINDMLSVIGESPVASLAEASQVADAQTALQILRRVSRSVQTRGWHWNTEENYRLAPNIDGEIILPTNTVKVDGIDCSAKYDMTFKGGKLWDRVNQTFDIGEAVYVDIVLLYPFEELPQVARNFIAQSAARRFENRLSGDSGANQINSGDAVQAWADLVQHECDNADYNVVKDSPTIRRIAMRRRW